MMITEILIFLLSIFIIPFNGKKPDAAGKPQGLLLTRIIIDSELFEVFTYTPDNKLSEEKTKCSYTKYTYDANNSLISKDLYLDNAVVSSDNRVLEAFKRRKEWVNPLTATNTMMCSYEYKNGRLEFVRWKVEGPGSYWTFKYLKNGRIGTTYFYTHGKMNRFINYTYDKKGNMIKLCDYDLDASGHPMLMHVKEYEFDNKVNPYSLFGFTSEPGQYTNPNNIIREKYSTSSDRIPGPGETFVYEYNEKGYPVSVNNHTVYVY